MKSEQLEKEFLKDRILPLLFSTKNAKLYPSARSTLNEYGTGVDQLQEEYSELQKKDEDFWKKISEIVSESFDQEQPEFNETEFRAFVKELLRIRFERGFRKNDVKKLKDSSDIQDFLQEVDEGNNIVLDGYSKEKIIYVGTRRSREYIEPLMPEEEEFYPPLLIEVGEDNDRILLSGDKSQRNRFVQFTKKSDQIDLQDEEPEEYQQLKIDPDFIHQLRSHDIFLNKINISGDSSSISLTVSSHEDSAIDIQDFLDYDLFLQEKRDILLISSCEFVYVTRKDNEEKDVEFKLRFQDFNRSRNNKEYIKISLELSKAYSEYREEIKEILKNYGIEIYEPYYKPESYYINKLLTTHSNYQEKYFDPLNEMETSSGIELLTDGGVLHTDTDSESEKGPVEIDRKKLIDNIRDNLEEAKKTDIELDGRQHRITSIEKDGSIRIIIKSYSDDPDNLHQRFYSVIIPFRTRPDKFDKIYNIILSEANYYKLLTTEDSSDLVKYVVRAAQKRMKYHQKLLVQKETRRSIKRLEEYIEEPEDYKDKFEGRKAGYDIEDHINVVMRYLFANYIPGGGKNEPDGALTLVNKTYLIDSKQSKSISKNQLTKAKEDVESNNLMESDDMIFVICKNLIESDSKTGSLNKENRERVSRETNTTFLFLSVEAIKILYEVFSEFSTILKSDNDLRERVFEQVKSLIEESKHCEDTEDLQETEEDHIGNIRSTIDNEKSEYMPGRENHYF